MLYPVCIFQYFLSKANSHRALLHLLILLQSMCELNFLISSDTSMERFPPPLLCYPRHLLGAKSSSLGHTATINMPSVSTGHVHLVSSAEFIPQYLYLILRLYFINSYFLL